MEGPRGPRDATAKHRASPAAPHPHSPCSWEEGSVRCEGRKAPGQHSRGHEAGQGSQACHGADSSCPSLAPDGRGLRPFPGPPPHVHLPSCSFGDLPPRHSSASLFPCPRVSAPTSGKRDSVRKPATSTKLGLAPTETLYPEDVKVSMKKHKMNFCGMFLPCPSPFWPLPPNSSKKLSMRRPEAGKDDDVG